MNELKKSEARIWTRIVRKYNTHLDYIESESVGFCIIIKGQKIN